MFFMLSVAPIMPHMESQTIAYFFGIFTKVSSRSSFLSSFQIKEMFKQEYQ